MDADSASGDDVRDELPSDLDASEFVGRLSVPRQLAASHPRRDLPRPGGDLPVCCTSTKDDQSVLVNTGFAWAAVILGVAGIYSITSGWRMHVDEKQALVAAQQAIDFPVGHASAQQVWHGVRSRPTWRVLCYSAEDPPPEARTRAGRRRRRAVCCSTSSRPIRRSGGRPPARAVGPGTDDVRRQVPGAGRRRGQAARRRAAQDADDARPPDDRRAARRGGRRDRDRRRPHHARPDPRDPGGAARPARRRARQGVRRGEPAWRLPRLDRRPRHRRLPARWRRLLLRHPRGPAPGGAAVRGVGAGDR